MPKEIGPTITRWKLGEEMSKLRNAANVTYAEAANKLGCSESKIKKIESGYVGMNKSELLVLLDMYGLTDETAREPILELQTNSRKRGWWSQLGTVPSQFATLLGLEMAATEIRIFEPLMVNGLLQTEAYARAIAETATGKVDPDEVEKQVRIRLARQQRILDGENPPDLWVILDEAVLRRHIGGPRVMKEQFDYLLSMAKRTNLQIVTFDQGGYPGLLGAFWLFSFDEDIHSPVLYVEGQGGNLYLEKGPELRRGRLAYEQISATALSTRDSIKLIEDIAGTLP